MSDDARVHLSATEGTASAPPPPNAGGSTVRGCLSFVGLLALIVVGLVVLGYIGLVILIQQSLPKPQQAVSAPPVAWSSREVVLTNGAVIHGRLSLSAASSPSSQVWVGLNAGVPSVGHEGTSLPGAGALLSGPLVRLTAPGLLGQQSCVAPCELSLPSAFDCRPGTCGLEFDVTIELLSDGSGAGGAVTVAIAGGASADIDERLPDGLVVDLSFEAATPVAGD